jgi:choline-sulfatase
MYDPDDLPSLRPVVEEGKPDYHRLIRQYRNLENVDESVLRKVMAVYLGMTSYVDHLLGQLLDALEETGQAAETAIIAFSDHGDWAGDYGLVEKWPSGLDDALTRVPLVVRMPGGAQGHVVAEPVELFDIVPTTLELAGIEARHTHYARSLVPQLRGAVGDPERAVFAEGGYDLHEPHCFEGKPSDGVAGNPDGIYYPKGMQQQEHPESVCRAVMIRTLEHKLVWRPNGQSELYDMGEDPQELRNVIDRDEYTQVQRELERRLLDWQAQTGDAVPHETDPRGFPPGLVA